MSGVSWALPHASFPFADITLHPFAVLNHNHEYNCFSESFESISWIIEPDADGDPKQYFYPTYKHNNF